MKIKYDSFPNLYKKLVLVVYCFLIFSVGLNAQSRRSNQWIRQLGGSSWDISSGIVCDSKSNLYLSGSFFSSLISDFKKVESNGDQDVFVARFDQSGIRELEHFGGNGLDMSTSICMISDNRIAVTGIVTDSAVFGKFKVKESGKKLFIAKCDDNLNPIWLTCLPFEGQASILYSGTSANGDIYISGFFSEKIIAGETEVISVGKKDIFIAIIGKQGDLKKLNSFGSEEDDFLTAFFVDNDGKMIISGKFGKIGGDNTKFIPLIKGIKMNDFIAKIDKDFTVTWLKQFLPSDFCEISGIKPDKSGNYYVSGTYNSKLELSDTIFYSKGFTDGFILKLKPDGSTIWQRSFGSWYYDYSKQLNIDNVDGVIISGSIGAEILIDSLKIHPGTKTNSALFLQFSSDGKAIWGDCISGMGNSSSTASVLDKEGNLYFTGDFKEEFKKENTSLISMGDQDIFVMKFANCFDEDYGISGDQSFCPGLTTTLKVKHNYSDIIWNDTIKGKYNLEVGRPGQYWVKAIDEKGCIISDTVYVSESMLPVFSLGKDTTISIKDSIILKAPTLYSVHHWHDLSLESEYIVKSYEGSLDDRIAWLMVKDSLECSFTDTITVHFIKSVEKSPENFKINVYPNPANDQIFWSFISKGEPIYNFTLEIINDKGVKLKHEQIKNYTLGEERELNISALLPGAYYLRISDSSKNNELKSIRFLKH